jgi:hypothetical protein
VEEEPLISIYFHFRSNLSSYNAIQTFGRAQEYILDHRRVVVSSFDPVEEEECDGLVHVVLILGVLQTVKFPQIACVDIYRQSTMPTNHKQHANSTNTYTQTKCTIFI